MSFFEAIEKLPEDPILGLQAAFLQDPRENKVSLAVGAYKTAEGKPLVLSSVRKAEQLNLDSKQNKEYLPIGGSQEFGDATLDLVLGHKADESFFVTQSIGGTGALKLAAELISQKIAKGIYLPDHNWPIHKGLFSGAGITCQSYPYYDPKLHQVNFNALCDCIKEIPKSTAILFQASCHNPTGIDPTPEQWKELSRLCKERNLFPVFDLAYQGFGKSLDEDALPIHLFLVEHPELMVAYSYSKNFGLYAERVGALLIGCGDKQKKENIGSTVRAIIRRWYSSPPRNGSAIVATILKDQALRGEWENELRIMRERIQEMRHTFASGLQARCKTRDFSFLANQRGMFSYSSLTSHEVDRLTSEYGIYMTRNGRINVAGLTPSNMEYVIDAIVDVLDQA